MNPGEWCVFWPKGAESKPIFRHYFVDNGDPWRLRSSTSLCTMEFTGLGMWAFGSVGIEYSQGECPACRARLNKLEGGTV